MGWEVAEQMIWFFLAGFISGAVGTLRFAGWWAKKYDKDWYERECNDDECSGASKSNMDRSV